MLQPTSEQLALLSSCERFGYLLGDFWNRYMRWFAVLWNSTFMVFVTWLTVARRIEVRGLDHVLAVDRDRGVILVANHRSFFDFFVVCSALFKWTRVPRRVMFPVRASFFYETPLGVVLNMLMSSMAMFPPIMRMPSKRDFNQFALERCVQEVQRRRTVLGIHPEGSRGRSEDPFHVHPGKLGMGRVVLAANRAQVIPLFVTGVSNNLLTELRRNWFARSRYPIHLRFGAPVPLADLRARPDERSAQRDAVDRCMARVSELADECREEFAPRAPEPRRLALVDS